MNDGIFPVEIHLIRSTIHVSIKVKVYNVQEMAQSERNSR